MSNTVEVPAELLAAAAQGPDWVKTSVARLTKERTLVGVAAAWGVVWNWVDSDDKEELLRRSLKDPLQRWVEGCAPDLRRELEKAVDTLDAARSSTPLGEWFACAFELGGAVETASWSNHVDFGDPQGRIGLMVAEAVARRPTP